MKNAVYTCNLENEIVGICNDTNRDTVCFLTTHTYNRPAHEDKLVLADGGIIKPINTHTFAYPSAYPHVKVGKSLIKNTVTKRKTNKKLCYLNHQNEQFCYTLDNNDVNLVKIEQKDIFVTEIEKPKKRRTRQKKSMKLYRVANLIKWDNLCFQPEIEAEYHCNLRPKNYAQYLNDPRRDPMFCQFDAPHTKHNCKDEVTYHDFYMGKLSAFFINVKIL